MYNFRISVILRNFRKNSKESLCVNFGKIFNWFWKKLIKLWSSENYRKKILNRFYKNFAKPMNLEELLENFEILLKNFRENFKNFGLKVNFIRICETIVCNLKVNYEKIWSKFIWIERFLGKLWKHFKETLNF